MILKRKKVLNLRDFLLTRIQNTALFEMAYDRKKAEEKIDNSSEQIYLHLLKVLYYKDSDNLNKHLVDITSWLLKIQDIILKPNSKRISKELYYKWLFDEPYGNGFDKLKKYIDRNLKDYKSLETQQISYEDLYIRLQEIYVKVCYALQEDEFEDIKDYL